MLEDSNQYKTSLNQFKEQTINIKLLGIPLYLVCLGIYSKVTVIYTGTSFLTTPTSWLFDLVTFYLWHVQAHYSIPSIPFNSFAHSVHNNHHYLNFPPGYFWGSTSKFGLEWRARSKKELLIIYDSLPLHELNLINSITNEFYAIVLYGLGILGKRYICGLDWLTIGFTIAQSFIILFLGNYLHNSFHTKSHWLEKYTIWRELRYLHYLHHCGDTKHNYAIFAFVFDKLFDTYKNK